MTIFWRAGEMEDPSGRGVSMVWAALSALVYVATWLVLGLGWPGIIGGQVFLLVGIGVVRAIASARKDGE